MSRASHAAHIGVHPLRVDVLSADNIAKALAREQRADTAEAAEKPNTDDPPPTVAQVRARIRNFSVVPSALTVPCLEHDAAVSTPCYRGAVVGVCWQRVKARVAKR